MHTRILHIFTELETTNGVANYIMNHYEGLDPKQFKVDFLIFKGIDNYYLDIISKRGDKVLQATPDILYSNKKKKQHAKEIFSMYKYDIVHCHNINFALPYLEEAKRVNVGVRIFHAHVTKTSVRPLKRFIDGFKLPKLVNNASHLWSSSLITGKAIFKDNDFYISPSAINPEKFKYCEVSRTEIRNRHHIDLNKKLLGYFGRFSEDKNPLFLVSLMYTLVKEDPNYHLLLVGYGELTSEIFEAIKDYELDEHITVVDPSHEIDKYYSAIDLFMLPSVMEGLPLVGVEALFANVPQIYSDIITEELNLLDTITYLGLNEPKQVWIDAIKLKMDLIEDRTKLDMESLEMYNIHKQVKVIEKKYKELVK